MWQLHFPLQQGETRTSHGPIPHPLDKLLTNNLIIEKKKKKQFVILNVSANLCNVCTGQCLIDFIGLFVLTLTITTKTLHQCIYPGCFVNIRFAVIDQHLACFCMSLGRCRIKWGTSILLRQIRFRLIYFF